MRREIWLDDPPATLRNEKVPPSPQGKDTINSSFLRERVFNLYMIKTAEFVSPKHPDKICDYIADSILDAYLAADHESRVAIEFMGGLKLISIKG